MPIGTLPSAGRKIFETVYNESLRGTCSGDKSCAARIAWDAVKNAGYRRDKDGVWHRKFDGLAEFSMHIKASYDKGTMRWRAVNSDTAHDSYDERMSQELFADFISRAKNNEPVPTEYANKVCSEYWSGGMPYLSVSHYPDLNGKAVPGKPTELYVDGDKLKAKGILFDTPLGQAVWKSLKEDEKKSDNPIRISIGFLDLAHRHGDGEVWVREGQYSLCPECLQGVGNKVYVKGYLVHLALTRVPVNKRTEMVLEEKSMSKKITRKEDAESIVGELAEVIDAESKVERSNVLIEMSDTDPADEETKGLVQEIEQDSKDVPNENSPETENVSAEQLTKQPEQNAEPTEPTEPKQENVVETNAPVEKLSVVEKSAHPLQFAIDELLSSVDNSVELKSNDARAELINPAMQKLGIAIMEYVAKNDAPPPAQDEQNMLKDIKELIQPLAEALKSLTEEVGILKAQTGVQNVRSENRTPQPKTISAQVMRSVAERKSATPLTTNEIARKSVGL